MYLFETFERTTRDVVEGDRFEINRNLGASLSEDASKLMRSWLTGRLRRHVFFDCFGQEVTVLSG